VLLILLYFIGLAIGKAKAHWYLQLTPTTQDRAKRTRQKQSEPLGPAVAALGARGDLPSFEVLPMGYRSHLIGICATEKIFKLCT
jgi:hypothetical protein